MASSGNRSPSELNPRRDPPLDFPDAAFGRLAPADYATLGFMAGLEVHQQILTRSKLFCRCPAGSYVDRWDAEVLRHMRPTLSELGEYDGTALMEFKTRKEIVYQLDRGTVCTYEIDDTPPFPIDDEAVRIAIEIATLLDLNLVSELHVMRKQYLDGSIPTGFQRTAMIGLDGAIPFTVPELGVDRTLRIRQLSLEEDSCREISDIGHRVVFRTDRLGMPLTETVTEPELMTPWEVRAAGALIADIARATRKVRRGGGAARQDVNVSIAGGRRIEIKGVSHHRGLPRLVHVEAFRQLNLLRIKAELERRGVTAPLLESAAEGDPWNGPNVVDAAADLRGTTSRPIVEALDRGERILAVKLAGFGGLLEHGTQPGITFAQEFSERVRVIACPVHRPILLHRERPEAGIADTAWRTLAKRLGAERGDAVVLVWGSDQDAATAAREVLIRAREALEGVPAETRQSWPDGTTGFERILPGADRMYPDTDTPPIPIADTVLEQIRVALPERPWERAARYRALEIGTVAAVRLARAPWAELFDAVRPEMGEIARRLAHVLERRAPFHERRGRRLPAPKRLATVVRAIEGGAVRAEALRPMFDALCLDPDRSPEAVVAEFAAAGNGASVDGVIQTVVAESENCRAIDPTSRIRWVIGEVTRRLVGRVAPADVRARFAEATSAAGREGTP